MSMKKNEYDVSVNLIEKMNKISEIIAETNIVTINDLSEAFNISKIETTYLLNEFLVQTTNFGNKYIIFFKAEIVSPNSIEIKIIPSYSPELESIIDNQDVVSFGVFAITKKRDDFKMNDYTALCGKIEFISRYDLEKVETIKKEIIPKEEESEKEEEVQKIKSQPVTKKPNNTQLSQKYNTTLNIINDNEDENYYGGYKPQTKPKASHIDQPKSRSSSRDRVVNINSDKPFESEDKMEIDSEPQIIPKKVKKIRKVQKTKTYMNESGYMVTKDEWVDEEYFSDEKPETKHRAPINTYHAPQPQKKAKKVAAGQSSIFSFFK